jgi:hypothetical protein
MVAILVVALVVATLWAYLDLAGPIGEAPQVAAAAPDTPPRVQPRAHPTPGEYLLCTVNGHTTVDWARLNGRPICLTCDRLLPKRDDLPFDREAAELAAETEAWLRGVA